MREPVYHTFVDGPAMVAPYSHAVQVDDWLFVTGQMPIGEDGLVPEGIEAQTRTVIRNLQQVIHRCGFEDADVVQTRVYLARFEAHYERMNMVYQTLFPTDSLPARTCIGVTALARGCDIEIDVVVKRRAKA